MKKTITFISDTHTKHIPLNSSLPGGDIIIHAGDFTSVGHIHETQNFCKWYNNLTKYENKIFIAGNHELKFESHSKESIEVVNFYKNINYLQDELILVDGIKIWGTPWQPEFCNWAFNLPKNSDKLAEKWNMIPKGIDILITHCPPFGYLDKVHGESYNLGCELLIKKVKELKPKIHVFGHIHSGYGYIFDGYTHYINAAVLDESYYYTQKPLNVEWDSETNEIKFL